MKIKKIIAAALAVATAATMVVTASAYIPTEDDVRYQWVGFRGNTSNYILNANNLKDYPEVTRSLVNDVRNNGSYKAKTADFWYSRQSSTGQILCVFSAGISLEEAYDLASQTSWYDVDGDRLFPALRYNESVKRFYLVNALGTGSAANIIKNNYTFNPRKSVTLRIEVTSMGRKMKVNQAFDIAIQGTWCLPNIKVVGTDRTGKELKHLLTLENGEVKSKWIVQYGSEAYARFSAKLYDTASYDNTPVKSVKY